MNEPTAVHKRTEHLPDSRWNCRTDNMPWPCAARRQRLIAESGDTQQLSIQMWVYFDHFLVSFPDADWSEAYARFLGWIPAREAQAAS